MGKKQLQSNVNTVLNDSEQWGWNRVNWENAKGDSVIWDGGGNIIRLLERNPSKFNLVRC